MEAKQCKGPPGLGCEREGTGGRPRSGCANAVSQPGAPAGPEPQRWQRSKTSEWPVTVSLLLSSWAQDPPFPSPRPEPRPGPPPRVSTLSGVDRASHFHLCRGAAGQCGSGVLLGGGPASVRGVRWTGSPPPPITGTVSPGCGGGGATVRLGRHSRPSQVLVSAAPQGEDADASRSPNLPSVSARAGSAPGPGSSAGPAGPSEGRVRGGQPEVGAFILPPRDGQPPSRLCVDPDRGGPWRETGARVAPWVPQSRRCQRGLGSDPLGGAPSSGAPPGLGHGSHRDRQGACVCACGAACTCAHRPPSPCVCTLRAEDCPAPCHPPAPPPAEITTSESG